GTFEELRLGARLAYWTATVLATYLAGFATVSLLARLFSPQRMPTAPAFALFGACAGLPVSMVVWGINFTAFEGAAIPFAPLLAYCIAISSLVSGLVALFTQQFETTQRFDEMRSDAGTGLATDRDPPRILKR